jgi:hypothetical protein
MATEAMNLRRKSSINRLRAPLFLLCSLCFLAILPLSAAQVNFFGTGVNSSFVNQVGGTLDTHWTITATTQPAPPNSSVFVAQGCTTFNDCGAAPANFPLQGSWADTAGGASIGVGGAWVSAFNSDPNSDSTTGYSYSYTETFDLTAFTLGSVTLSGFWAADNCANIVLNGTPLTATDCTLPANGNQFSPKTAYTITNGSGTGFIQGINTITWVVKNYPTNAPDPSGLLVESTSATGNLSGAPEPATLFGVGLGLGVVGLAYRRRRRS